MKTIEIKKHKVEIYDSIEELPIKRFHKFNKYLLIDAGVGSDLNTVNDKIGIILRYIDKLDNGNAKIELENLRQSLYLIAQETNVNHLSYMLFIKKIDGKEITDVSDEGIRELKKIFEDESLTSFTRLFQSVKKKIDEELNLYFPVQFDDTVIKEYYEKLKSRILYQLDAIIREKDNSDQIDSIDNFLLSLIKPKLFSGKDNYEIKYDKQFDEMCLFLSHELSVDIDRMTVLQFYNAFEYIKKIKKGNGR